MSQPPVTYTNAKTAMTKAGLPVSAGANWTNVDVKSWATFLATHGYVGGAYELDPAKAAYGFAYPSVMPAGVTNAVGADNYSATLAALPLAGAHPVNVTFTLTETNSNGQSFSWNFGDGTAAVVTAVPTATHSYAAAGTFTAHVTPTVNGVVETAIAVTAPVVVS
jgi:PKD repeat protein